MNEFFCYYCNRWIDESVHRNHHHNDLDKPDQIRDPRERRRKTKFEIAQLDKQIEVTAYQIKKTEKLGFLTLA